MTFSRIISCGHYLPKNCVKNADLPTHLETNDDWIQSRTGITQRYMAAEGEMTSDLAAAAAREALKKAGLATVDAIIVATTTPDNTFPATAVSVQKKLGITSGFAFDIQAVCAGFVYALSVADNFVKSGQAKTVLVIGAETMTRIVDWNDRGTCVLFGDGAGAVILAASETPGVIMTKLHSDGSHYDHLYAKGPNFNDPLLKMNGREVYKHAVEKMGSAILEVTNGNPNQIDWLIPHQANLRIMSSIADHFAIPLEKVVTTVNKHANTSAASIPLAICDAHNKFKSGDIIALTALGGGFSWGSALLKW